MVDPADQVEDPKAILQVGINLITPTGPLIKESGWTTTSSSMIRWPCRRISPTPAEMVETDGA